MQVVSTSSHIVTTMGAINGKAGEFRVLNGLPSITEMRRTIALLKRYQLVEPLDVLEELNENTRMVIYPSIQAVLLGDDIRELLGTFGGTEEENQRTLYGNDAKQRQPQETVVEDKEDEDGDETTV